MHSRRRSNSLTIYVFNIQATFIKKLELKKSTKFSIKYQNKDANIAEIPGF